jgi:UDP-2-acetamido-2-deoxy-ribo-hexuluronate aminotransferase
MEFIDLKKQQAKIRSKIDLSIGKVLDHGKYILGPEVQELEERLAKFIGVKHCIAVSSGTDALLISMMALNISNGDEVITTPFTFAGTIEAIVLLGAKPVYVDICAETYNIDPNKIENAISDKTKLILPVSLYGQCCDLTSINIIAKKYLLPVLEDGCQSFGAKHNNEMSCGSSTIGCTSFFPSKPLGCYGDGGAIFTNNDKLSEIIKSIRIHGQDGRYNHSRIGINGRMDTIQAAILLVKFDLFRDEILLRNNAANFYNKELKKICDLITIPFISKNNTSVYAQYTLLTDDRDSLIYKLSQYNIPTAIHYPVPIHKQPAYTEKKLNLPISESVSKKVLSIPISPYITKEDQSAVIRAIELWCKNQK